jgi:predicted branched-subunit amino acid permease
MPDPASLQTFASGPAAFRRGYRLALISLPALVLAATFLGIGALAHDLGFTLIWTALASVLIWAGPAQVILVSTLGKAPLLEVAVAVGLSGVRLLPMVVSLLPILKGPETHTRDLILPAHWVAISSWVEGQRLLPGIDRRFRIAFFNGFGCGMLSVCLVSTIAGWTLTGNLPKALVAGLLFLTPIFFLVSVTKNARHPVDRLAVPFGLVIALVLAWGRVPFDLLWTGLIGGTAAYAVHRFRRRSA